MPPEPAWLKLFEPAYFIPWAEEMLRTMNDGAVWTYVSSAHAYKINKVEKTLTLIAGEIDVTFWKNLKTFGKLGYTVQVPGNPEEIALTE